MLTNYETAKFMVSDHQQQLRDEAGRRRLIRFARRARRVAESSGDGYDAIVHQLPSRERVPIAPEELAAS